MHFSRKLDISQRVLQACRFVVEFPDRSPAFDSAELFKMCEKYVDKPDDFVVEEDDSVEEHPINQVKVFDLEELEYAIRCVLELNANEISEFDLEDLRETIEHEGAHADAAKALGFGEVYFTLIVEKYIREIGFYHMSFTTEMSERTLPVTKLGDVSISLAPKTPSGPDIDHAIAMGYKSVFDVAKRIAENNRNPQNQQLPVPGSFDRFEYVGETSIITTPFDITALGGRFV